MSSLRAWCFRFKGLFNKERKDRELAEELEAHVRMHTEENVRLGMTSVAARRDALIKLGGLDQTKEKYREGRGLPMLESVLQDFRFGFRMLRKSPGFTTIAILTLTFGIGANIAIFSVIDRLLLNLFPFPQPERLVSIYQKDPGIPKAMISYPNFLDFQKDSHTFESMTIWRDTRLTLSGKGDAQRLSGKMVSSNYFSVLGIAPILGRTFSPDEDQLGSAPVALIGEAFWKSQFAADSKIAGTTLTLNGKLYTVVGVVPSFRVFRDLGGDAFFDDVYVPIGQWNDNKYFRNRDSGLGTVGYGRLRASVTLAQARADADQITEALQAAYPTEDKGISIAIFPLKDDTVGAIQPVLWTLFAAVGFVLLIACTNIANLLLARSAVREHEFAVRAALGATRARLIRQYLTEGALLSVSGGTLAIGIATLGTKSALRMLPPILPGASLVALNSRILLFALVLSIFTGILFALVPALKTSRPDAQEALKESGRSVIGSRHRVQGILVVSEIGLALVLLIGAGLMIRSIARIEGVNPGFNRHNVLTFAIAAPPGTVFTPEATTARLRELNARIGSVPGVESASLTLASFPFRGNSTTVCWPVDRPKPQTTAERYPTFIFLVGSDYFQAMRIPLLRGRVFTAQDDSSSPTVALVDEDLAKTVFGNQDPIGKKILFDLDDAAEIVGVVGHVKTGGLDDTGWIQIRSQLYLPYEQLPPAQLATVGRDVDAVVRASLTSSALLPSIQKTVKSLDAGYVIHDPRTMDDLVEESLAERRFSMSLLIAFAGTALVLAIIGIYGVISYLVTERTHELGIRMALGARRSDILRMVVGKSLILASIGIAIGIAGAFALTRALSNLLFGVGPTDPITFVSVVALLLATAGLACYFPARRATKVDPMVALRFE
jgi:predicted permease